MYQEWPHDLEILDQDRFPLPKDVYDLMAERFSLPISYPHAFGKNKQTPLQISQNNGQENSHISVWYKLSQVYASLQFTEIVLQTTCHPAAFTTMALSFDSTRHVTCGYLGYNCQKSGLVEILLSKALEEAAHPLVLPTLFFNTYMSFLQEDTFRQVLSVRQVRKANADLVAPGKHIDIFKEFSEANNKITLSHDILSTSITPFTREFGHNLGEAFDMVDKAIENVLVLQSATNQDIDRMRTLGRSLKMVWEELEVTRKGLIDVRQRSLHRLEMQRQVVSL